VAYAGIPDQPVRFVPVGRRTVAWSVVGSGPPLLVGGWWMSHLELNWLDPRFRRFIGALATHRTVVRYDRPGTGLSDHDGAPPASLAAEVEVLAAVVDALETDRVALFGGSSGGPAALVYAAEHPERIDRLVLYGSFATGTAIAPAEVRESMASLVRARWGLGSRVLTDVFLADADAEERDVFARFQREAASADIAARSLEAVYGMDVADAPRRVEAATLVLHRREDTAIPFALGRDLAGCIPGAVFAPLAGREHFPWRGDAAAVVSATLRFLGVPARRIDLRALSEAARTGAQAEAPILSRRELEVLRLVANGLSDAEIAAALVLSQHTVHRHIANIRTKLGVPSRAAAAAQAARLRLV
jgi:pimeloyl-ACP methyl ester carboxylesterase/DNA-binding CsgD family transcriptional regulator